MAKGFKTGGRNFQKGVVTNPKGRKRVPKDVRKARTMTKNEVDLLLNKFMFMQFKDIKDFHLTHSGSGAEHCIASIIVHAVKQGCHYRLDFLLNRLIGKVKEQIEHSLPTPTLIQKPDGSEVILSFEPGPNFIPEGQ